MAMQEEELELSLGLSIGGRFGSYEKSKPIRENLVESSEINGDCKETDRILGGSRVSPAGEAGETGGVCQTPKKDIHALRRQEARKKREEKQHKKGASRGKNGGYLNGCVPIRSDSMDDQWFVAQVQTRVRDREAKEIEAKQSERNCKKNRTENGGSDGNSCVLEDEQRHEMFSGKQNQTLNQIHGANPSVMASSPVPFVPMQYSYAPLKCVPFGNGFAYPYVMPCWAPSAAALSDDKNVFQPVPSREFVPFQVPHWNSKDNVLTTCDSEQDGCKQSQSLLASTTSGSRGSSSSVLSDQHSGSRQASGGSSSDTRSHSSCSLSEQPQMQSAVVNDSHGQSDHSSSSQLVEYSKDVEEATMTAEKVVPSSITQQTQRKTEEGPVLVTKPSSINKPILNTNSPSPQPLKEVKKERSKPPKPQTPPLPHVPCVSTTGTGPNGKTITGFLYRYTKSEVSIICVCHGTSFSPAEFVKHAGGTDISHPLRHIIMVPSSCG